LVISDITNPFFTAIARGCEDFAQLHGYALVLANTDEDSSKEATVLEHMAAERAAGIVLVTRGQSTDLIRRLASTGIPVVGLDRRIEGVQVDTVVTDNERGAYEAAKHLIQLGHERIGIIKGPDWDNTVSERYAGYRRALRDGRIGFDPRLVGEGNLREGGGYRATVELFDAADPPTAIFSVNNLTTIGVLRAVRERGLRIPEDVSLLSFDDLPTGEFLAPPLTALAQDTYQLGTRAAELLIRRIVEPNAPVKEVVLAGNLVVRGSTGPAQSRAQAKEGKGSDR
jgi:DNA-binding LacI/PurR family transcriptional regulator